jgi:positive regulator of sigma E activity
MITGGTISKIEGNTAYLSAKSPAGGCCGGSKGDGCCGGKSVIVRTSIPQGLALRVGDNVEISEPSQTSILSFFMILVLPAIFFALAFSLLPALNPSLTGSWQIGAGSGAFVIGLLMNLFLPKHSDLPHVTKVLTSFSDFKPIKE